MSAEPPRCEGVWVGATTGRRRRCPYPAIRRRLCDFHVGEEKRIRAVSGRGRMVRWQPGEPDDWIPGEERNRCQDNQAAPAPAAPVG